MACQQNSNPISRAVRSRTSAVLLYEAFTDWMSVVGVDAIRAVVKCPGCASANFSAQFAVQYAATRPEVPGAWTAYGTAVTGGSEGCFAPVIVADAASQMWFRMGIGYKYVTAADEAYVTFQAAWNACGDIVDTRALSVFTAPVASVGTAVLTEWMPATDVDRVKAALEVAKYDKVGGGTFNFRLAYQTATTDVGTPGAWTAVGTSYTDANTAVNTGEIDISAPASGKMFVRIGLMYWQTSAGSTRADFNTIVGVRRAGPLTWGDTPSTWGSTELGLQRTTVNNAVVYSGANSPYGDVYDHPSAPYTLATYAETSGDPSGPSAWGSGGTIPWWIGYSASTGKWGVYTITGGVATLQTISDSPRTGPANALSRISVNAAKTTCTFSISLDGGVSWHDLHTRTDTWDWRGYVIQDSTTFTVKRELRT